MDLEESMDKRDSRGSSVSSTPPKEGSSSGGPSSGVTGVMRRRGSLFELVTGREPVTSGRNLSGSDNAINTRHRALESRLSKPTPHPLVQRRPTPAGVTIVRPTKEARKAEIVAAVTRRLYTARKKPDPRAELSPSLSENAEEADQIEPKELKLCSNARARLQEISKRAMALGLHRRLRKDSDTQTEEMTSALRVKEKSVSTDEPTREIGVDTTSTACEANLVVDFGKRVEMAEKSSQWKTESASIGTQSGLYPPPLWHIIQPAPVYGTPPFWQNHWWHKVSWSCCDHEQKRRANISLDSTDDFSDDSLESLCGISRVGPDGGASGDTVPEPRPALWDTLTLRSGKQFRENSSLYQPDVFRASHPLASIFQKEISFLGRDDKSTETEFKMGMEFDEKACNTEPFTVTVDEESQTVMCSVHAQKTVEACTVRVPSFMTRSQAGFQVVCDFTVACNSVPSDPAPCSCEPSHLSLPLITATPEKFPEPTTSATDRYTKEAEIQNFHCPETPFSTPDIIAQASNDCKNVSSDTEDTENHRPYEADVPHCSGSKNGVGGLWEGERPFVSLDNTLSQPKHPEEDSSRARSLDSIFQPMNTGQNTLPKEIRPNSSTVKKFRLPCLSENKTPSIPVSVTARAIDDVSSPTKTNLSPAKRITPSSFLSPKGRRLLLTWLNNPGSNPSTGTTVRSGRKKFNGRVSRRHANFKEKCHRRVATKRVATEDSEKVSMYHNISTLISEATNYVRTMNQSRPQSSEGQITSVDFSPKSTETCEAHRPTPNGRDSSSQSEKYSTVSLSTDPALTAEKAVSTPKRLTTGIQCALNFSTFLRKTNTFALFWISRSTQTDMSLWNDKYLLADDILLEAQSIVSDDLLCDPVPHFVNRRDSPDRPVNIYELPQKDEFRTVDRYDSTMGYCGRSTCLSDFTRGSRLPCQHSSPRAYLRHLVSLRRGIVEACQSPPARPTGVG